MTEFEFRTQVSEKKVSDVLSELKNTTSWSHDDINVVSLKKMKDSILPALQHVINLSLKSGDLKRDMMLLSPHMTVQLTFT